MPRDRRADPGEQRRGAAQRKVRRWPTHDESIGLPTPGADAAAGCGGFAVTTHDDRSRPARTDCDPQFAPRRGEQPAASHSQTPWSAGRCAGEVSAPSISGSRVDALRAQLLLLLSENPQLMEAISDVNSELFTSLRDSIDAKPRVSVESVAGGHRLATGKFSCSSCRMMGPSFQSSELFCMGCGTCAVCCSQSGSMCSSAGPDAVASTHVVSNTPNQVDCIRCGHHSRSKNASQGRCSACSLCSVCCTKVPICVSAQPAYSAPSAVNFHQGCASLRPTQVGEHICKSCGGRYKRCMGSYGYRSDNGKGTWSSGPCPADLSQYPESPNPSWCTAECERLSSGNQPAGGIPALGTDLSAQLSAQLFAQFSAAQGQVAHVFEGLQQQLESPPMSEGESLIRDMIAQNAERDVIDAVLAGFDPAEAEAIRARIGL